MVYNIFKDGYKINAIVSSAEFVDKYCILNGYTWEPVPESEPEPEAEEEQTAQENSVWDELDAAYQEGVDSV